MISEKLPQVKSTSVGHAVTKNSVCTSTGKLGSVAVAAPVVVIPAPLFVEPYAIGGRGVTTPEGISSQDVTFTSPGPFNVRLEKIKNTNESVQSGLTVVPEFPVGMASIATTLAIATIIIASRRMSSFVQMGKMY